MIAAYHRRLHGDNKELLHLNNIITLQYRGHAMDMIVVYIRDNIFIISAVLCITIVSLLLSSVQCRSSESMQRCGLSGRLEC